MRHTLLRFGYSKWIISLPLVYGMTVLEPCHAATRTVTSTSDSGAGTLRNQIAAANPGDTINFSSSLAGATITLQTGQVQISNSLEIDASALVTRVTISGNGESRVFQINSNANVKVNSIIFDDCFELADVGGAIKNDGGLTASNCLFQSNGVVGGNGGTPPVNESGGAGGGGAGIGGAIYSDGASLTLISCVFNQNTADGGNGGNGVSLTPLVGPGAGGGPNGGSVPTGGAGKSGGFGGGGSGAALSGGLGAVGGRGGFGGGGGGGSDGLSQSHASGGAGGTYGGAGGNAVSGFSGGGGGGAGLGGAIFTQVGTVYITNCIFSGNKATAGFAGNAGGKGQGVGGGVFIGTSSLVMVNCAFSGNTASTSFNNAFAMPQLTLSNASGNLQFTWPTTEPGFSVQYTTNLLSPITWQALGTPITNQGTYYQQISSGAPGTSRFFRLAN